MKKCFVLLVVVACCCSGALAHAIVYVDADASGGETGANWTDAATSITAGLALAATGEEIWVRKGSYFESVDLTSMVSLYGGFAGNETDRKERNWVANGTIIDATGSGDRTVTGANGALLDGFTVTGGDAELGGGISCENINMSIAHCVVMGNHSGVGGAGIHIQGQSSVQLSDCIVKGNSSDTVGAGLFLWGPTDSVIQDCTVEANTSSEQGGGLFAVDRAAPTFRNCYFLNNVSNDGGALSCESSAPVFQNCVFAGNHANSQGGGIFWSDAAPVLYHTTITGNSATVSGGGVYSGQVQQVNPPRMANSIVWDNTPESIAGVSFSVTWSDVEGAYEGDGNISETPYFAKVWDGVSADVHLLPSSPCIDAGTSSLGIVEDFDGDARPFDVPGVGFDGQNVAYDMGADEYAASSFEWDYNNDGIVDAKDLLFFYRTRTESRSTFFFEFTLHWFEQP